MSKILVFGAKVTKPDQGNYVVEPHLKALFLPIKKETRTINMKKEENSRAKTERNIS